MKQSFWEKYHHKNQFDDDCSVVAILNIYYFLMNKKGLTFKRYDQESEEYKIIYNIANTDDMNYSKTLDYLHLMIVKEYNGLFNLTCDIVQQEKNKNIIINKKNIELPLLACVYHHKYGLHCISIVEYEKRTDCYRMPNFDFATTNGWIFGEILYGYTRKTNKIKLIALQSYIK